MAAEERSPLLYEGLRSSPPEPPTNYVNGVAITVSPWDFCLLFLRGLPAQPLMFSEGSEDAGDRRQEPLGAEIVQRIVMSPEHAKSMVARLQENLDMYEREYGVIPAIPISPSEQSDSSASEPPADRGS
jgi:hypothetical protein